ncbi:MAG: PelD GGDEF domain-containing protein [Thiobacillaceae bacterium]
MRIPVAIQHKVLAADRAARRLLPRTVTLWKPSADWRVATVETMLFMGAALALSWLFHAQDPFWLDGGFPWLWLVAAIIALRYGSFFGAFAMALALVSWLLMQSHGLVEGELPHASFLGGLILALICGEFCDVWNARLNQAYTVNAYIDERLHTLTHNHFLLAISHERLEQEFIARPFTLREMIVALRKRVLREPASGEALPSAGQVMLLLAQICRIESAGLFAIDNGLLRLPAAATMGDFTALEESDPMLSAALESGQLTHIQSESFIEAEQSSRYLVCAPMVSSGGHVMGVLVVERMPFTSMTLETMQFITVVLGYYADSVDYAGVTKPLLNAYPDCPEDFALELVRVRRLFSTAAIRSALVAFLAQDERAAADWFSRIDRLRRDIDVSWAHDDGKHRLLLVLLPLTSAVGVAGYIDRVVRSLREQYGVDFASAGLAVHSTEIDARPLTEQLAAFLERCLA